MGAVVVVAAAAAVGAGERLTSSGGSLEEVLSGLAAGPINNDDYFYLFQRQTGLAISLGV